MKLLKTFEVSLELHWRLCEWRKSEYEYFVTTKGERRRNPAGQKKKKEIRPTLHSIPTISRPANATIYSAPNYSRENHKKKRKKRKNLNKESKREEEKYGEENKKKKIQAKHDRERTKKSVDQCQFWEELARRSNESFCNNYCRQIITALHVQSSRPHRQNSKRKEKKKLGKNETKKEEGED